VDIKSIEDAKNYAVEATNRCLSNDETHRRLEVFRNYLSKATNEEQKEIWQKEIDSLENWLECEKFKTGDFPRGIDELMLELIEWRALKYAFQNIETEQSPFKEHIFYSQWLVGGTYAVFAILGQLVSGHKQDHSLIRLWKKICEFIEQDGGCSKEEIIEINLKLDINNPLGYFTNKNSKALLFRNKVIAHNEKNLTIRWDEIDKDIEILVRIWSLVVSWSSFGLFDPFRTPEQAFSGLEYLFSASEITALKTKRKEYIERVMLWSVTHLHNGERDHEGGVFKKLSITTTIFPP